MKVSLLGVILENLQTTQSVKFIKAGSKVWKDKVSNTKKVSLGGIGRVGVATDAMVSTIEAAGGITRINTSGASIAPNEIISGGIATLSISSKPKKLNGIPYGGFLGFASASPFMRVSAANMKTIYGYNGVAAILIAGTDAAGNPTYAGSIKSIGAKKNIGNLIGEAHLSNDIKFKSPQGTFIVYRALPTQGE